MPYISVTNFSLMLPKRQIVQTFSKYSYEINLKILGEIFHNLFCVFERFFG